MTTKTKIPDLANLNLDDFSVHPDDYNDLAAKLASLADYCYLKSSAIAFRLMGKIASAQEAERKMQAIYEDLPENWRW
jgi:hypothetical protein